jgi:Protein of unknown function (DUF4254)
MHLRSCPARGSLESRTILLIQLDGLPSTVAGPKRMLEARQISQMHDQSTIRWHRTPPLRDPAFDPPDPPVGPLADLILAQHRANFDLWHEEDKAREPGASDACITQVKHNIDALNQTRNDLVEAIDRALLEAAGQQNPAAPLHSETPGLIIDRLSILALKIYHTAEEAHRTSASQAHHQKNSSRLALLQEQRADLAACLDVLWAEVLSRKRRFKLYRQMKMYNDPELNPMMYAHKAEAKSS